MDVKDVVELLAAPFSLGAGAVVAVLATQWLLNRLAAGGDGYAKKKGENLATKEDLADAVKQLKEFESARMEVAHTDWIAREWKSVRARNLEVFAARLQENYEQADSFFDSCIKGIVPQRTPHPAAEVALRSLQNLYYPELKGPVTAFLHRCSTFKGRCSQLAAAVSEIESNPTPDSEMKLGKAGEAMLKEMGELKEAWDDAVAALTAMAHQLYGIGPADKQR